jgi:hypothetical protein
MHVPVGSPASFPLQEPRLLYKDPKVQRACLYAAALVAATCVAVLIAAIGSWRANDGIRHRMYYGDDSIRVAMLCVSLMLLTRAASALAPDPSALSGPAFLSGTRISYELVKSGVIIAIHCTAVAAALSLLAVIGLAVKPVVSNASAPSVITSLDLVMLPSFKVYMYFVLREVLWAQRIANDGAASNAAPPRLFFRPNHVPWVLWTLTPSCFSIFLASRLVPDRVAAAPALFVAAFILNILLTLHGSSMLRALQQDARWPSIRAIARFTQAVVFATSVASTILEVVYQFAPGVLLAPYATLIVESFVCCGQLPLLILGVTSNGIIDRFWRDERAAALNTLAQAHASVAGQCPAATQPRPPSSFSFTQPWAHCVFAESRQDLLRWLAHETRVPLNSLYMGLQLLSHPQSALSAALPARHDEITTLSHCRSASEALISVLSDVLDLRWVGGWSEKLQLVWAVARLQPHLPRTGDRTTVWVDEACLACK